MTQVYVKVVDCKDKTGKAFKAYETFDKTGNRINIRFCMGTQPVTQSCYIELVDWWQDKRKQYPTIRVREYNVIDTPVKNNNTDIEF